MSKNDKWYLEGHEPSLRMWIFQQMTYGAVIAALVFFGIIAFILILGALRNLLPEDPYAALETGKTVLSALV